MTTRWRISELAREREFVSYHRLLNHSVWSPHAAFPLLPGRLAVAFVPTGTVVLGIDNTVERHQDRRINAKRIYRDPVRSSHWHFAEASGFR